MLNILADALLVAPRFPSLPEAPRHLHHADLLLETPKRNRSWAQIVGLPR